MQITQQGGDQEDEENKANGHEGTFHLTMIAMIPAPFTGGNSFAEPYDGMRQPSWVAQTKV